MEGKKIVKFVLLTLFFIFMINPINSKEGAKPRIYYADEVTRNFANQVEKKFELYCIGSGGSMPYDIREISIKFIAYRRATIEEARELEVKVTESFINAINSHENIRPYLREYPFNNKRVEVSISFCKYDYVGYKDGSVSHVFQTRNKIFYNGEDPLTEQLYHLEEEPYEEALKIVQNESGHHFRKFNKF